MESHRRERQERQRQQHTTTLYMNGGFFGKLLKEAFENDEEDLDPIVGDDNDRGGGSRYEPPVGKTATQQKFLDAQASLGRSKVKGAAPIAEKDLINTKWSIDFYLAGIPDQDPSNNLYGSKVNISSRDAQLALGASVPEAPSISVRITLLEGGICR
jgi:hypothetical protein